MMDQFTNEEKLHWQLEQLPGVIEVDVQPQDHGLYRVGVVVEAGKVDDVWADLVEQVDSFERSLAGEAGLDLSVTSK